MKLHWLAVGILAASAALFGQGAPPADNDNGPADEPGRAVARLAIVNGDASVRRGDSNEWVAAAANAPLMTGDQISVAAGGRAEVQIDSAHYLRIGGDTELRLADLENGHYQIQVAHGFVTWRVLRDTQAQAEIDTPLVGVHPEAQSAVRVEVNGDGTSHVTVRRGEVEVSTQKGSEKLGANNTMDVRGDISDPEFQVVAAIPRDDFDNWSDQRDTYLLRSQSQRYVTQDVHGVEDLDSYGKWIYDPAYGWVWAPQVAAGWAPYQDGRWVWEDYYGWTWVDYAPWGWAPFHYGYWYNRVGFGWAWYPGPRVAHVWWRPAMVGFFGWGGGGISFGFGNIGWVPLGPHEVFRPWYGRGYTGGVIVARNVNITTFRNAGYARGVTAADFQRGNFRNSAVVDHATLASASFVRGRVPMTPSSQNLRFSNRVATVAPNSAISNSQRFYGHTSPAGRTPFAQQQSNVRPGAVGTPSQNPDWSRFQSRPNGSANPSFNNGNGGNAPRAGYDRFGGAPQQVGPGQNGNGPRQIPVSPSIIRQRPENSPGAGGAPRGYDARPQQAPPQYSPSVRPQQQPQGPPPSAPRGNFGGGSAPAPRGQGGGGERGHAGGHR